MYVVFLAVFATALATSAVGAAVSTNSYAETHPGAQDRVVQDTFSETCSGAPVVEPGIIQGEINTPNDIDVFRINVTENDYLAVAGTVPSDAEGTEIYHSDIGAEASIATINPEGIAEIDNRVMMYPYAKVTDGVDVPTSYKVFAEESGQLCIAVREIKSEANIPYQWTFQFAKNEEPEWWTDAQTLSPDEAPSRYTPSLDPPSLEATEQSPTPTETAQQTPAETEAPSETEESTESNGVVEDNGDDGSGPGFGVGATLAALGGVGYFLRRRLVDEK